MIRCNCHEEQHVQQPTLNSIEQQNPTKLCLVNLEVRRVSKQESEYRERFLMEQINNSYRDDKTKKAKILENLLRAKNTEIVFKKLRAMIKGSTSGTLLYIMIPKPFTGFPYDPKDVTEWEPIYDQVRM